MTLTLELPNELESELVSEAKQSGLSVADYTLGVLLSRRLPNSLPQNGAELVAYWQSSGLVGTRTDIGDSQLHARKLRSKAQRRKKQD